jgi:hypothetical protein
MSESSPELSFIFIEKLLSTEDEDMIARSFG